MSSRPAPAEPLERPPTPLPTLEVPTPMSHSTRSPHRTQAEQIEALVADHARLKAELDQALAGNRNAAVYAEKLAELGRALDVAQDGFATVMPIARIRQIVGFRHNCRYGIGDHQ